MSKKGVISLSIIAFLIVLIGVLFGAVFCLRTQSVTVLGESAIEINKEDIVSTAGLKNGQSIFLIDKETAIQNIEKTYANLKVVQIKTTSVTEIEICVRVRHEMFYTEFENNYYVLDEDLKVLDIISNEEQEPTHLTHMANDALSISASTIKCDFVGTDFEQKVTYDLYSAMITVVTKTTGEDENKTEEYLTRSDVREILRNIEFEKFETYNKIVITTSYGVKLDIERPNENLTNKINICFSTIKEFLSNSETENKAQSGTIKIYYDLNDEMQCVYIPETVTEE